MALPYYYAEEKSKLREGLIPIIIIILIAIVLVGKTTNFFCGVPGLTEVFCGGGHIRIAVIGDFNAATGVTDPSKVTAPNLKTLLDGPLGKTYGMYYNNYRAEMLTYAKEALIKNYDLVILVGERKFSRPVKDAIGWYVANGGKLVVIGDAGVIDPDDPLYVGWGGGMFDVFPVQLDYNADLTTPPTMVNTSIKLFDINHPIVKGYQPTLNLSLVSAQCSGGPTAAAGLKIIEVMPTGGGVVASLNGIFYKTVQGSNSPLKGKQYDAVAIVESGSMFGGKVIYFAYDPGCTPNLWISTVGYLTGKIHT